MHGTDSEFIGCIAAMIQHDGFTTTNGNNRYISCKAFCCGLSFVSGAGFRLQGALNSLVGCEFQQNVFENIYMYNSFGCNISGTVLDGAGYLSDSHFPSLTYHDTEFNVDVPISSLRTHNCRYSNISVTIVNGRTVDGSLWNCADGIYCLYPYSDRGNNIKAGVYDVAFPSSFKAIDYGTEKDRYMLLNQVVINGNSQEKTTGIKYNSFLDSANPYATSGTAFTADVQDQKLALSVSDSSPANIAKYTLPLSNNAKKVGLGFRHIDLTNASVLNICFDVMVTYQNGSGTQYKNTPTQSLENQYSAIIDIKSFMAANCADLVSLTSLTLRVMALTTTVGTGTYKSVTFEGPTIYQYLY
jgi:hypothetical protein